MFWQLPERKTPGGALLGAVENAHVGCVKFLLLEYEKHALAYINNAATDGA